jgi:hypothetical protein
MLLVMPDEELPEPEHVVIRTHVVIKTGKAYKEGKIHAGPAPMDWPPPDDDGISE